MLSSAVWLHFVVKENVALFFFPETDRAFKQFVFECIDIATTDPNGFIVTRDIEGLEHSPIPWDDPYSFFKGMILKERKDDSVGSDDDSGLLAFFDILLTAFYQFSNFYEFPLSAID